MVGLAHRGGLIAIKNLLTLILCIANAACGSVSLQSMLEGGEIFVGMSKDQLAKAYYWNGGQDEHPFSFTAATIYLDAEALEIIVPYDQSIFFVFENVSVKPTRAAVGSNWSVEPGVGTLKSFHFSLEDVGRTLGEVSGISEKLSELQSKQAGITERRYKIAKLLSEEQATKQEQSLEKWRAATGALIAGSAAYAAIEEQKERREKQYEFDGTGILNSEQLGNELLRQKRVKGIQGKGGVVDPLPNYGVTDDPGKPIPKSSATAARIGYKPKTAAMRLQYENPNFCRYSSTQTLVIQKLASVSCPRSVEIPSPTSSAVFDYGKFFTQRGLTGTKVAQTQTSCTYRLPSEQRNITMPKGTAVACPSSYDF